MNVIIIDFVKKKSPFLLVLVRSYLKFNMTNYGINFVVTLRSL